MISLRKIQSLTTNELYFRGRLMYPISKSKTPNPNIKYLDPASPVSLIIPIKPIIVKINPAV
jgi:hypothetical protein